MAPAPAGHAASPSLAPILGVVGAFIVLVSTFMDYVDGFKPVDFDAPGLAVLGSIIWYWGPAIVAGAAAIILLVRKSDRFFGGLLLGGAIAALLNPLGQLFNGFGYESDSAPGLLVALFGSALAVAGGVIAAASKPTEGR